MENEDYRIITLHGNKLKVYRDGRIEKIDKKVKSIISTTGYYVINLFYTELGKKFKVHRIIAYAFLGLDIENPKEIVDHIDRNKLNNNVVNLRIVTKQQNAFNTNSKGYFWDKPRNKWRSRISVSGKHVHLGRYKTEACARYAYLTAKNHYHQF
tara:strand:+ start:1111 stop:1572 length:462 start_codon:yes stop_codon:yes gene_type:complete